MLLSKSLAKSNPGPLLVACMVLALAGCATSQRSGRGAPPVEDRGVERQPSTALSPRPGAGVPVATAQFNPGVIALLNRANEQSRAGDLDQAGASLERALRIDPDNPWLWHRLALVRLFQKQNEQAVSMAGKSNALAPGNRRLQADNWRLIAQARERMGQLAGARSAAARAAELSAPRQ